MRKRSLFADLLVATIVLISQTLLPAASPSPASDEAMLKAFAQVHPIDSHVHIFKTDGAFQAMVEQLNLKVLNILVVDDTVPYRKELRTEVDDAVRMMRSNHGHVALCTTFDPYKFNNPSFTQDSIDQLNHDFGEGAIAVKIWKNVGMEIKDRDGKYVMADDAKFEPIYKDIASRGKTLVAHQAEPDVAWGPPDPTDPSWSYYKENPQWFVGNKSGFPSKQTILAARDHILRENPGLRVVGVHLGSLEKNLSELGKRLDEYPNFAVDTAGRMDYLMLMPREQARAFLIKYQDRVLYGTDLDILPDANTAEELKDWQSTYARDWRFMATDDTFSFGNKQVHGLKLPNSVLQKLFHENATKWIPGL